MSGSSGSRTDYHVSRVLCRCVALCCWVVPFQAVGQCYHGKTIQKRDAGAQLENRNAGAQQRATCSLLAARRARAVRTACKMGHSSLPHRPEAAAQVGARAALPANSLVSHHISARSVASGRRLGPPGVSRPALYTPPPPDVSMNLCPSGCMRAGYSGCHFSGGPRGPQGTCPHGRERNPP